MGYVKKVCSTLMFGKINEGNKNYFLILNLPANCWQNCRRQPRNKAFLAIESTGRDLMNLSIDKEPDSLIGHLKKGIKKENYCPI